jgi:hypothetical protein
LNLGRLGGKRECYLCAMPTPNADMLVNDYLGVALEVVGLKKKNRF